MTSFDISLLFTNVPLDGTINIIISKLFLNSAHHLGFTRAQFRKLLSLAVKNCHFIFNGHFYEQMDGVAMGSPLGPLSANICLSSHERTLLDNCSPEFKLLHFRRYVDDCFIIFKSQDHVQPFLNYLNPKHRNIEFTSESEVNGCSPFLYVSINRIDGFSTSVNRKPTFTGLFTTFDSFIPSSFKRGLIYSLLNNTLEYAHPHHIFQSEVIKLKEFLVNNDYSVALFDRCLSIFLDKIFSPPINNITVPKRVVYFCLPFTGTHSLQIRTKLIKLVSSCFPQIDLHVVLKPGKRLSTFLQFKHSIPKFLKSHVVYQYKCQCCAEHVGISYSRTHGNFVFDRLESFTFFTF